MRRIGTDDNGKEMYALNARDRVFIGAVSLGALLVILAFTAWVIS